MGIGPLVWATGPKMLINAGKENIQIISDKLIQY